MPPTYSPAFDGVLFFPVTPFTESGAVDLDLLARHIAKGVEAGPGGVFIACGTGEFHALEPQEFGDVVRTAVEAVAGRVPVYAGAGGSVALAKLFAKSAKDNGADGLLLLPPYLVELPQAGLVAYTREVAAATDLPMIVYNRNNARYTEASAVEVAKIPNVIGFKDGTGDLDKVGRIVRAVTDALKTRPRISCSSTGCRPPRPRSRPTAPSVFRCTPLPPSPSRPTSRWPSTTRSSPATTRSRTPCREPSSIRS